MSYKQTRTHTRNYLPIWIINWGKISTRSWDIHKSHTNIIIHLICINWLRLSEASRAFEHFGQLPQRQLAGATMQLAANCFNRIHRQFHVNKMPFCPLSLTLSLSLSESVCDFVRSSRALKLFSFILKCKWYLHTACGIFISIGRSQARVYPVKLPARLVSCLLRFFGNSFNNKNEYKQSLWVGSSSHFT